MILLSHVHQTRWCHIIDYNFKKPLTPRVSLLYSPQPVSGPSLEQDELIHILIQYSEPEIHVILFSCVSYLHRVSDIQIFMIGLHLSHLPCMLLACLAHCPLIAQNIWGRVKFCDSHYAVLSSLPSLPVSSQNILLSTLFSKHFI
jgi:hypothetical protein